MKYVPIAKRSKAAQKAYYAAQRGTWNGVNPVTRVRAGRKHATRQQTSRETSQLLRESQHGQF